MGFRFYRGKKILPGITLTLSRSGPSISFGVKGAKVTEGSKGNRATVGLHGIGLFYTEHVKNESSGQPDPQQRNSHPILFLAMGVFFIFSSPSPDIFRNRALLTFTLA